MDKTSKSNPKEFLKSLKGKTVLVKTNTGVGYSGKLVCLDGYMVSV